MKKVLKTIQVVFFSLIVVIGVVLLVSILPITGNLKVFVVLSGSMEPAIKTGSVIVAKPVADYKIGDIITFGKNTRTETPTTHRIVEILNDDGDISYTTKGDANNAADNNKIAKDKVIGKVFLDVPYLGYAISTAKKPYGFLFLIVVPALIIVYGEGEKIWKEAQKIRKGKNPSRSLRDETDESLSRDSDENVKE
ncbi:MAG: signal peptidase I [Patescibacteria group bacterium]|jgi:signal peptidase|nr:signal peptidase I [Patescibacteria group bacterium]